MDETFRRLIEEPSSSPEALERKEARLIFLHTRQIPSLRIIGFLLMGLGVLLHNQFILGDLSWPGFWKYLLLSLAYAGLSWIILWRFYRPRDRFDLAFLFLTLDILPLISAVYLSGAERSWLFFILLARVADQTTAGFRRALFFAHLVPLSYAGMLLYVVFVDGRAVSWGFAVAMLIFLYGCGGYLVLTAKPNDRRRRRAAEAVTIGRELIAQLREKSEELLNAKARAEAANEAKSRFLNNASHELRTPLNAVLGLLEILRSSKLSSEQEEAVSEAQAGAEHLLGTLDDIIDYSALEGAETTPAPTLETTRVEVRQLVDSAVKWAREAAEDKGLEISSRIDPGTPQSFFSDPRKLRRILGHLLTNALKFSDSGTIRVTVRRQGDTALRFEVRDSGAGVPAEERAHIFQPFTQLDASAERRHHGTGLGLALCRVLVKRMGGEVGVEDGGAEGGAVFWFTVEDHKMGSPSLARTEGSKLPQNTRVLVVEDDPINQKITYHQLLNLGVQVEVADSGAEALERLAAGRFDLILMDIQMPEMDGYSTTQEFRRREVGEQRTPVVALTAHALPSDRQRCLEAGMDEHLSKPVSSESLQEVLLRWVSQEVLHPATQERLRELGARHGRDLLGEMAEIFLREVPDRVSQLGAALDENDQEGALFLAHSIKGSCNSLGVRALADLCLQIEECLRERSPEEAAAFYPAAREALRAAHEPLQKLVS